MFSYIKIISSTLIAVSLIVAFVLWAWGPGGNLRWVSGPENEYQAEAVSSLKDVLEYEQSMIEFNLEYDVELADAEFLISSVDLNNDDKDELFLELRDQDTSFWCSIGGKCTTFILQKSLGNGP